MAIPSSGAGLEDSNASKTVNCAQVKLKRCKKVQQNHLRRRTTADGAEGDAVGRGRPTHPLIQRQPGGDAAPHRRRGHRGRGAHEGRALSNKKKKVYSKPLLLPRSGRGAGRKRFPASYSSGITYILIACTFISKYMFISIPFHSLHFWLYLPLPVWYSPLVIKTIVMDIKQCVQVSRAVQSIIIIICNKQEA